MSIEPDASSIVFVRGRMTTAELLRAIQHRTALCRESFHRLEDAQVEHARAGNTGVVTAARAQSALTTTIATAGRRGRAGGSVSGTSPGCNPPRP